MHGTKSIEKANSSLCFWYKFAGCRLRYNCFPSNFSEKNIVLNVAAYSIMQWYRLTSGPVWKIVNIWPKNFYVVPFQKLVFLISLYPEFLEKNQRNKKKNWFLVNSRCFCFAFHANLMSDGKKKRLKFLFITSLILLINMSVTLFRWTV